MLEGDEMPELMPAIFFGHGNPMRIVDGRTFQIDAAIIGLGGGLTLPFSLTIQSRNYESDMRCLKTF